MPKNEVINIICNEDLNLDRLKYTIDFIDNHPLKPQGISLVLNSKDKSIKEIFYSSLKHDSSLSIPVQNMFFSNNIYLEPEINQYKFEGESLYSVEKNYKDKEYFITGGSFGFDILETIFFHISRYEEYHCSKDKLDIHKRMNTKEQLLPKNKLHYIPVVDNLIFTFFKAIGLDVKKQKTTYSLTHDIDIIRKYNSIFKSLKSIAKAVQMNLGIGGIISVVKSIFKSFGNNKLDPYYTYDWLFLPKVDFIHKTVYFVAGGNTRYDLYNENYLKELPNIISKAIDKSYKIGFHPSYNAYNNIDKLKSEYNRLNNLTKDRITNVRTHYLRLDIQKTFELFEELGFEYDSTLGYADDIGFRCGTGFEYFPYNFKEERAWKFKEIPLSFMDSSL